jgi:hypothetical protein
MVDHIAFASYIRCKSDHEKDAVEDAEDPLKAISSAVEDDRTRTPYDQWPLWIGKDEEIVSSSMLLMVPTNVPAFSMKRKTWG